MDDDDEVKVGMECDTETCMVVEIQENELGEIMLVERAREEVFDNNRFCVVDCEVGLDASDVVPNTSIKSEHVPPNIEIVYLPDYNNPCNGPVILKQELVLHNDGIEEDYVVPDSESYEVIEEEVVDNKFLSVRPETSPKVYKRNHKRTFAEIGSGPKKFLNGVLPTKSTASRLRANPNILVKHNGVFHSRNRSWARELDCNNFVHSKSISSVTTIHTKPKILPGTDGSQHETIPDSKMIIKDIEGGTKRILSAMPHKCQHCDRSFRQSVSLQIHSRRHGESISDSCHVS